MPFMDRMKEARIRKGLTQEKIAKEIGVAKSTYTGYEKGNSEPNMLVLSRIMNALDVDANFLFQDEMAALHDVNATPEEMENLVKKYRSLDQYGKEAVDSVLDVEWRRCTQPAPVLKSGLDDMEQLLIQHFPGLPPDIRQSLLDQMQAMKESQKEEPPSSAQE